MITPPSALSVAAPAKLNLALQVLGRREDGYHELRTVFQALSWGDVVVARRAERDSITFEGLAVPSGTNLVSAARDGLRAYAVRQAMGAPPVALRVLKRIPAGSGLGGGSADAAAVLVLLPRLWGWRLDPTHRRQIAAWLGADVSFGLLSGRALGLGRGDQLQPLPSPPGWAAVCWPDFGVSTAAVFDAWDRQEERRPKQSGDDTLLPAALAAYPQLEPFRRRALEAAPGELTMTGSGGAHFRIHPTAADARHTAQMWRAAGLLAVSAAFRAAAPRPRTVP